MVSASGLQKNCRLGAFWKDGGWRFLDFARNDKEERRDGKGGA